MTSNVPILAVFSAIVLALNYLSGQSVDFVATKGVLALVGLAAITVYEYRGSRLRANRG